MAVVVARADGGKGTPSFIGCVCGWVCAISPVPCFRLRVVQKVREVATRNPAAILAGVAPDEIQLVHPKAYLPHPDKQGRPM